MVEALLRIEISCALTSGNARVPLIRHEIGAAEKVVGFGIVGGMADLLFQTLHRQVHLPGGKQFFRRSRRVRGSQQNRREGYGEPKKLESRATTELYRSCHSLRNHLDGNPIGEGFRFLSRQGDSVTFGETRGDLHACQILQRKLDGLVLHVMVHDFKNVGLALIDAEGVAL